MSNFVSIIGANENNLKNVNVVFPRHAIIAFTGVSGSGKSSLVYGTLYAEAQRRFLETVSPYVRRFFRQLPVPRVEAIEGLPPAVALRQQHGAPSQHSSVGSVTTLSHFIRILYSRAGTYPPNCERLDAEAFSVNAAAGACAHCRGQGTVFDATETSMVIDDSLTIRQKAIAAWPPAWHGQNLRDICVSLGFDIDRPWREMSTADRNWILFTEERPTIRVYPGVPPTEVQELLRRGAPGGYNGTFVGARRLLLETFASSSSSHSRQRASRYIVSTVCTACGGKGLRPESLSVRFAGYDIVELLQLPLIEVKDVLMRHSNEHSDVGWRRPERDNQPSSQIVFDLMHRVQVLMKLGLGYLSLDRPTSTLSTGEIQRLRVAAQLHSNLFGVLYVLDEPSAGLHPDDTEALFGVILDLRLAGNTICLIEHNMKIVEKADWIVDLGPSAGEDGGHVVFSGLPAKIIDVEMSQTAPYLFSEPVEPRSNPRLPKGWLQLTNISINNLHNINVRFPLGVLTGVCGVSGSGKSSLVSRALVGLMRRSIGMNLSRISEKRLPCADTQEVLGSVIQDTDLIERVVVIDQKPIGRSSRSNLATYTGMFDQVRRIFAGTGAARERDFKSGHFSFNGGGGRCLACDGLGSVTIEMLFLPEMTTICPTCHGARYEPSTLNIRYRGSNIADVLAMTVETARSFFHDVAVVRRALDTLQDVGLGYLPLGQPVTDFSGGEAQRLKLASELQRQQQATTLYVLDEPTTGLHPSDVDMLFKSLNRLVDHGSSVVVVEHDPRVLANVDWIIEVGPGAGAAGGGIIASGVPAELRHAAESRMARHLRS